MTHYLIIGAGSAGISAAETIRRLDAAGEVTLVCAEADGYYSRPGLAYYLADEIPEKQLYPFGRGDFQRLQIRMLHAQAQQIIPQDHQVLVNDGRRLGYDRLLIATGASAVMAKLPGTELQGVVKLDNLEETRRLLRFARKGRRAVVVGGGITALELAEGLRQRGMQVNYLLRGERYWPNVLDETESRIVEQRLKQVGVRIHYQAELSEILGKGGKVVGVRTTGQGHIPCDLVGMAIGVAPRKQIGETAGLKVDKGILVDDTMLTSVPDIYAAGDAAQVYDARLGKSIVDSLWEPARAQGRIAGINMVGQTERYVKAVAFNVTRLAGITATIIGSVGGRDGDPDVVGIVRGDSEGWRQVPDAMAVQSNSEVNRLRLLVGERHLVGGVVMGDQRLSGLVYQLVAHQIEISSIRQKLFTPGADIETALASFIPNSGNIGRR
jgi:NAD(P)H-nitrite reductase large subunit